MVCLSRAVRCWRGFCYWGYQGGSLLAVSDKTDAVSREIAELEDAARAVERHLLRLITEAAGGLVPLNDLVSELELLAKDVMRSYRRVFDLKARRDLAFSAVRQLDTVGAHYVWLFRRAHLERLFYTKLDLERQLRNLVSQEVFEVYQRLLRAEEQEREVMSRDDVEISALLLGERSTSLPVHVT